MPKTPIVAFSGFLVHYGTN